MNRNSAPLGKQYHVVGGKRLAYHERGEGDAIVFLHGNPTSSYLWRNVIPHLERQGRCVAPDLIGMGDPTSSMPPARVPTASSSTASTSMGSSTH